MIVFIVSECRGKARERSQRTLDAFLPRIGRRSWSGRISEEGLERLRKTLKGEASRSTAIACHRVRGTSAVKVAWRIGSRSAFDLIGRVPVSVKGSPIRQDDRSKTQASLYLKAVTVAAALLHDVGKASKAFQKKLSSRKPLADPVRHEMLSVYAIMAAVQQAIPDLVSRPDKDMAVAAIFRDGRFLDHLDQVLKSDAVAKTMKGRLAGPMALPTPGKDGRVLVDLCHLILTHHRLATSIVADGSNLVQPRPWSYLRGGKEHDVAEVLKGCAFEAGIGAFGKPQEVDRWKSAVKKAGGYLVDSLEAGSAPRVPCGTIQHNGRLALMLGDHHASAVGNMASRETRRKGLLYANTPADPGDVEQAMGQTIARHLVSVAHASAVAVDGLGRLLDSMPSLIDDEIPEGIGDPSSTQARFAWQAEAKATITKARPSGAGGGFLAFLMASTGSGKTRAIPTVLLAARPDAGLRYSIGLGLRSLTLQTANEYTARLGFHRDGVTVALGSSLARRLDAVKRRLDQANSDDKDDRLEAEDASEADIATVSPGTDAEDEDIGLVETLEGEPPTLDLPAVLQRMNAVPGRPVSRRDAAARSFLAAPILVSTLDQLMPVATSTRGGHLTAALRTATSDLVIDEIDEFSPEDVAAICRLVDHAASHGRNVVVSSATLPPPVAAAIFAAYSLGWSRHAALAGKSGGVQVAWLSDAPGGCSVSTPSPESFAGEHAELAGQVASFALSMPWKRRVGFIDLRLGDGPVAFLSRLSGAIAPLHAAHHSRDPITGRRVSTGVVRMANVKPAMEMALHLLAREQTEGPVILVVPYVGTLLPAVRFKVESILDRLLTRTGPTDPLFGRSSPIRTRLDDGGTADIAIVVVTTSLEETGRDHDFDWAVVEPGSARGLVQLAGRVRRHRTEPAPDAEPNILVPRYCYRSLTKPDWETPFSRPGIEDSWKNAHGRKHGPQPLSSHEASDVYGGEGWERAITAAPLISPHTPGSQIAAYERNRWERLLIEQGGDGLGPARLRDVDYICDAHQRWRRFRRQDGPQAEFRLEQDGWHILDDAGTPNRIQGRTTRLDIPDESRLLIPIDVDACVADLIDRMGAKDDPWVARELVTVNLPMAQRGNDWGFTWHPALGSAVGRR